MELELAGKAAYVTGAAQGIGAAIADSLAGEGVHLAVSDLDGDLLAERATAWTVDARPPVLIAADLSQLDGAESAARAAADGLGQAPDILVNNVGVAPNKPLESLTDLDWQRSFELNFMSAVRTSRVLLPAMSRRGSGSVVAISSDLAKQPEAVPADYGAFKAALTSFSKSLAIQYAGSGVRVNVVCPGPIWTGMWSRPGGVVDDLVAIYDLPRDQSLERFYGERRLMMGMGQPQDVARLVTFLVSPAAMFITASVYDVNGGSVRSLF